MKLVIDIPEELYKNKKGYITHMDVHMILDAIKNSTPLPKGHGRLGDLDALEKLCYEHEIGNSAIDNEPVIEQGYTLNNNNIWVSLFDLAPTIIEADKESEE